MSFDLYFLEREQDATWEEALSALEEASEREDPFTPDDEATWQSIVSRLEPILGEVEVFVGDRNRELSHMPTGLQVSMFPGEISLSVPYWYEGPEAERMTDTLRDVARAIEGSTGLTAYDPQAEAPFLGTGDSVAARTMSGVRTTLRERGIETGETGDVAVGDDWPRDSFWRRLLRRGR